MFCEIALKHNNRIEANKTQNKIDQNEKCEKYPHNENHQTKAKKMLKRKTDRREPQLICDRFLCVCLFVWVCVHSIADGSQIEKREVHTEYFTTSVFGNNLNN